MRRKKKKERKETPLRVRPIASIGERERKGRERRLGGTEEGHEAILDEDWLTREIEPYKEVRIFPALGSLRNRDTTEWAAGVLWV